MTDRELMQQALDALEFQNNLHPQNDSTTEWNHSFKWNVQVAEALRARLVQLEPEQDGECQHCDGVGCVACDAQCLPQRECQGMTNEEILLMRWKRKKDEIIKDVNRYRWLRDRSENVIIDIVSSRTWESVEDYKKQLDDYIDHELKKATPSCLEMAEVITELPQREWQRLTDEEIQALDYNGTRVEFVRAIEAKLLEKNGD